MKSSIKGIENWKKNLKTKNSTDFFLINTI